MKKILIAAYVVAALALVALACVIVYTWSRPKLKLPADFVEVEEHRRGRYEQRAIAADGTAIGLRRHKNPENGSLKFWADAVRRELTDARGYELLNEEDVKSEAGKAGRLMNFSAKSRGKDATFMLALFVTNGEVLVAEAGGTAEAMKSHAEGLKKCLLSAR